MIECQYWQSQWGVSAFDEVRVDEHTREGSYLYLEMKKSEHSVL